MARPSREFAPAGDSLSWAPKKVSKEAAPAKPPIRKRLGTLRFSVIEARAKLPPLRSGQTVARSQLLKRAKARASMPCDARRFRRGNPRQPAAELPTPNVSTHSRGLFLHSPSEPAEERTALRPRAQHASRTDSAQLSDRSVAKGVLRGASRAAHRREPLALRGAGGSGATLCLLSGRPESRSPAGANSRHGPQQQGQITQ